MTKFLQTWHEKRFLKHFRIFEIMQKHWKDWKMMLMMSEKYLDVINVSCSLLWRPCLSVARLQKCSFRCKSLGIIKLLNAATIKWIWNSNLFSSPSAKFLFLLLFGRNLLVSFNLNLSFDRKFFMAESIRDDNFSCMILMRLCWRFLTKCEAVFLFRSKFD